MVNQQLEKTSWRTYRCQKMNLYQVHIEACFPTAGNIYIAKNNQSTQMFFTKETKLRSQS